MEGPAVKKMKRKRTSGLRCVAFGCSNTYDSKPKVSMHTFPDPEKEKLRHNAWVNAVKKTRADWKGPPSKSLSPSAFRGCVLCSDHFEEEYYIPRNRVQESLGYPSHASLTPDAIPTKFFRRTHDKAIKKLKTRTVVSKLDAARHLSKATKAPIFEEHSTDILPAVPEPDSPGSSVAEPAVSADTVKPVSLHKGIQATVQAFHFRSRGLKKKLSALSKKRDCELVGCWQKSLASQLYFCARRGGGDAEVNMQVWKAVANHIRDIHTHPENVDFPVCEHGELIQARRWFSSESIAFQRLSEVMYSNSMMRDIKHLSGSSNTSGNETFNALINYFAPKMYHYHYFSQRARIRLAVLHFNENNGRGQRRSKAGEPLFSVKYVKYKQGCMVARVSAHTLQNFMGTALTSRRRFGTGLDKPLLLIGPLPHPVLLPLHMIKFPETKRLGSTGVVTVTTPKGSHYITWEHLLSPAR